MKKAGDILKKADVVQKAISRSKRKPDPVQEFSLSALTQKEDDTHYTQQGQLVRLFDIRNQSQDIGFIARLLTLATMPHSNPGDAENYTRINGDYKFVMRRGEDTKLPYGSYPRLVLAWVCSEAVQTKARELALGDSLSSFMRQLGLIPTGGRWGTIPNLREQLKRLFNARISVSLIERDKRAFFDISKAYDLWWDHVQPTQVTLWKSTVTLSEEFFKEIIEHPIPINMKILKALKRSPLGLDLYMLFTYRVSYLKQPAYIPLSGLHQQFGAEYKDIKNFKRKVHREMLKIKLAWPQLNYEMHPGRLVLYPSQPSIPQLPPADKR
ncbi:MAG TPA: replication protein RepA [Edaphobacter sp.]|nr:replication protein RepA [Edaphobacter sp.]